jgi:hypothetical protein
MSSDENKKKPDLNQEFDEKWEREHREPEEGYVISEAERAGLRAGAYLARVWDATVSDLGLANKARQKALAAEAAKIQAELDAEPVPNGVPVASDDKEKKRIAAMKKVNDPTNNPFLSLDEAAAVLRLRSTRAVQKRIRNKKNPLEQGPHDGTVSMDSLRKALKIRN